MPMDGLAAFDHYMTTTRSVRKRLDFSRPGPREVIEECLEIALQAPSGSNAQGWRFLVVTDPAKKKAIRDYYKANFEQAYGGGRTPVEYPAGDPRAAQMDRVRDSATHLAEHMHEAPAYIIPCIMGRPEGLNAGQQAGLWGSILPAAWSLMLALRSRGLGTAWTTLHMNNEKEIAELLGIPAHVTQAALFPVAYFTGEDFKPANRLPLEKVVRWEQW
ncbi:MAG: nitroreductase family protein [Dehalococcoidia bacterium]|nr:nitroreductase family protein [Dehalococcoidia bacterium]